MKNFARVMLWLLMFGSLLSSAFAADPLVLITNLPAYGATGVIGGVVRNASPASNRILLFNYVAGDWYSKPGCANPYTTIQPDGSWSASIFSTSGDRSATQVAALLVPNTYTAPCVDGLVGLSIPSQCLAVAFTNRFAPAVRQFNFAGYTWGVKSNSEAIGPGPNFFSGSSNNVWVDAQGFLHLKITHVNNTWQCAEIISARNFGYGQYRFNVLAPITALDPSAVLGLFTYSNDSAYDDREIDIELSRWNNAFGANNVADFAIAPYASGQLLRFSVPATVTNSTHSFIWQSNTVAFQSLNGPYTNAPASSNILKSFLSTTGVPPAGGEQVHLNLWLNQGNAPVLGQPVEVIISDFDFIPLGPPPATQITNVQVNSGGHFQMAISTTPDWHYQIQSSSNLLTWTVLADLTATNNSIPFIDTNTPSDTQYYRVLTKP